MILTAEKLKITMVQHVAAIFACPSTKATDPLELLFIRRAINPRDRWSGHIAFPGGRVEAGESALDAARRETMEEVGVDLTHAEVLGQLDDRLAARNGLVPIVANLPLGSVRFPCLYLPHPSTDVVRIDRQAHEYVLWGVTYSMYLDIRDIVSRPQYPPDAKSAAPSYVALYYRLLVFVVLVVVALAVVSGR
ncbi:hypothetical protein DYB35_002889 [Aphanomyces astaci]|uniref:Nudix hydrolase domain-containing protein n=1 Tax=Aphanomyces astaci TaxID=112090 RepID=A0A3R7DUG0_APHAT|nr:hypothetical protein DYB35_002889 [Aphanomyces astaci]